MKNIHFKTCTCLLGILLILFSGIQVKGASLEVQQESKISGTVTDEKGEPVIGASVVVVESKQGTITDIDGKFLVNVPKNGHLKVSYIGYETQEVAVKNRQLLKIVLKEESTALNEVVVVERNDFGYFAYRCERSESDIQPRCLHAFAGESFQRFGF